MKRKAAPHDAPRVVIFAGPNGAGKSTHADAILQAMGIGTFVNADYIARGLAGANTETVNLAAGRIMLRRLQALAQQRQDFAFETTLSSRTFAPFLRRLKVQGYRVVIFYFWLRSAQLAVRRVKHRVALGGHHVPPDAVKRRYGRSRANFIALYAPLADEWVVYDNSLAGQAQRVAHRQGDRLTVKDPETWQQLNANPNPSP